MIMKKIVMLFLAILTLTVVYIRDGVDGVAVPCVALKVLSAIIGMIPICLLSFVLLITPQYLR